MIATSAHVFKSLKDETMGRAKGDDFTKESIRNLKIMLELYNNLGSPRVLKQTLFRRYRVKFLIHGKWYAWKSGCHVIRA